ncbi:MAG: hypothetical protein GY720_08750, partial [bacterium]|nr:hypothetical protein [bacterium]
GAYRLTLSGTKAIYDTAGNPLDGDGDNNPGGDYIHYFDVDRSSNQAPVAVDNPETVDEDGSVLVVLDAADADGDVLDFGISTAPRHGSLSGFGPGSTPGTYEVTYIPDPDYNGSDSFEFQVDDGKLGVDSGTIDITVNPVNDLPTALVRSIDVAENGDHLIVLEGTDLETLPSNLSFTIETGPDHGTLAQEAFNAFRYTPTTDYFGPDAFNFSVTDRGDPDNAGLGNELTSLPAQVDINVLEVNLTPQIDAITTQVVDEGDALSLTVTASDPDLDTLSFSLDAGPTGASIDPNTGLFSWTAFDGPADFGVTVRVTDDGLPNLSATTSFQIQVQNVAPTLSSLNATAADEGGISTLSGAIADAGTQDTFDLQVDWGDGNVETFGYPAGTGTFSENHQYLDNGSYSIGLTLTDDDGGSATDIVAALIGNTSPTIVLSGAASVAEGAVYDLTLGTVTDPGLDIVTTYRVHWGDGSVEDFAGAGLVQHTYADGDMTQAISVDLVDEDGTHTGAGALSVDVTNVDPTLGISGPATVDADQPYTLILSASDPGTDTISDWTIDWGDGTVEPIAGNPATASHTYAIPGDYAISAGAADEDGNYAAGGLNVTVDPVLPSTLQVTSLTPTPSGFTVLFNRAIDSSELNLYDTTVDAFGPADVTLVGAASGAIAGSLVVDAGAGQFTYIATGGPLANDTYTVSLRSGADGFKDGAGELLDGNADGSSGDDYSGQFSVTAFSGRTLSIPDIARGPGQTLDLPATGSGLPLRLSDGAGVTSVSFTLNYDPALLQVNGVNPGSGLPAGATLTLTGPAGAQTITVTSPTPLAAGELELVRLDADVPDSAPYTSKQLLDIADVSVNGGAIEARGDDGLQLIGYFGDTTGNAEYSTLDAQYLLNVVVKRNTGFGDYRNADPVILGDISGDGRLTGIDGALILRETYWYLSDNSAYDWPAIPPLPTGIEPIVEGGPDPFVSIPTNLIARPGELLTVPVNLDIAEHLESVQLELAYDPNAIVIENVRRGTLTDSFSVLLKYDSGGLLKVDTSSTERLVGGQSSLLLLDIRLLTDNNTLLDLRRVSLNEGNLVLSSVPVSGEDPTDGWINRLPVVETDPVTNKPAYDIAERPLPSNPNGGDRGPIGRLIGRLFNWGGGAADLPVPTAKTPWEALTARKPVVNADGGVGALQDRRSDIQATQDRGGELDGRDSLQLRLARLKGEVAPNLIEERAEARKRLIQRLAEMDRFADRSIDWEGGFADFPLSPEDPAEKSEEWIERFVTDYTQLEPKSDPNAGICVELPQEEVAA